MQIGNEFLIKIDEKKREREKEREREREREKESPPRNR